MQSIIVFWCQISNEIITENKLLTFVMYKLGIHVYKFEHIAITSTCIFLCLHFVRLEGMKTVVKEDISIKIWVK